MTDYTNPWPSWGETGELPADGFFYEGGDQVNEKHLDALWNTIQTHADDSIQAVEKRVTELEGNVCLDQGLVASQGTNARDVDVSASNDGAYISGQHTGAISATTLTLSSNSGGGSTRTDVIYVQQDGSVAKSEGTTANPSDTLKVAEVDLNTSDTITDIRVYTKRHVTVQASEEDIGAPNSGFGIWLDETDDTFYVRRSGAWDEVAVEGDSVTFNEGAFTGNVNLSTSGSIQDAGVDAIQFDGNQNVTIPNGDLDLNAHNLNNVGRIDSDLFSNSFLNLRRGNWDAGDEFRLERFNTPANASIRWQFYDDSENSDSEIVVLHRDGNVTIPNGDLELGEQLSNNSFNLQFTNSGFVNGIIDYRNGGYRVFGGNGSGGQEQHLYTSDGGNVTIPNGDLDVSNNNLLNVNNIFGDADLRLNTAGGGADIIRWFDQANAQDILKGTEGGDVDIPNGGLEVFGNIRVEGANPPQIIANSTDISVDRRTFSLEKQGVEQWSIVHDVASDDAFTIVDATNNFLDVISAKIGGNVEIPNGELTVNDSINVPSQSGAGGGELDGAIESSLQSSGSTTDGIFQAVITDDTEASIRWIRNASVAAAFNVRNQTSGNNLLLVNDNGNVDIPNGSINVGTNGTIGSNGSFSIGNDGNGAIELGNSTKPTGTDKPFIDFSYSVGADQDFNIRLENNTDEGFRFRSPTEAILTGDNSGVTVPNGDLEVGNTSGGDVRIAGELTENASL